MKKYNSVFTAIAVVLFLVATISYVDAKDKKEQVPFTRDTTFTTKNITMYQDGDTLKVVTKKLTTIEIKNSIIKSNGIVLAGSKAVMVGKSVHVTWLNPSGTLVVYKGNKERKKKATVAPIVKTK